MQGKELESARFALKNNADHVSMEDDGWARRRAREALAFVNGKGLRVLNAGCGPGFDSEEFKKAGHHVVGIDFDQKLIDFAAKHGFQQEGKVADLNKKLPFADHEFDVIFCSEVVEHLPILGVFLGECNRILKNDGLLLLTTDNPTYLKNRIKFLFGNADFLTHQPANNLWS